MLARAAVCSLLALTPAVAQTPPATLPPSVTPTVRLPLPETLRPFAPRSLQVKRTATWQLWAGGTLFRDFGQDLDSANEVARVLRELQPMQWASIGTDRTVIEYGLTPDEKGNPVAPTSGGFPKAMLALDHRSARVENVRGAWCVRDDANILLNFGPHRIDAEQALAVARKYGFNRIGLVGKSEPVLVYFFAQPQIDAAPPPANPAVLTAAAQAQQLTRTGIEVPGVGFVGERITIDPRKVEVRRDRGVYTLAHGPDVLAKFGGSEWAARDAVRLIQDARLTEFCRFGTQGVTFFLRNGQTPQGLPFFAQASRFDPNRLAVRELGGKWWVCEAGRTLLPAGSADEADTLMKLIRAYGFDQIGQVGTSPTASLRFLAKGK